MHVDVDIWVGVELGLKLSLPRNKNKLGLKLIPTVDIMIYKDLHAHRILKPAAAKREAAARPSRANSRRFSSTTHPPTHMHQLGLKLSLWLYLYRETHAISWA